MRNFVRYSVGRGVRVYQDQNGDMVMFATAQDGQGCWVGDSAISSPASEHITDFSVIRSRYPSIASAARIMGFWGES